MIEGSLNSRRSSELESCFPPGLSLADFGQGPFVPTAGNRRGRLRGPCC